ncbi:hypothetical protein FMK81_13190 [Klebsiella oxytoca]|uniref:toxin YdaT family protein n=1 Tax=Klebsiella oxytoca TaxID=571 RepID=UPI001CCF700D|nr:toxin YdaT family protein [Klebsiella oxytoca]MBZ7262461.1 hypothetical protein [Klebsiella oxytoca]
MMITPALVLSALNEWEREVTQEVVVQKITEVYFCRKMTFPVLHQIVNQDLTVNHDAWRRNRVNFNRWKTCQTVEQRQKFEALIPAVLDAMPLDLSAMIRAGNSIEYLTTRLLKRHANVANAALLHAPLHDFERFCDELDRALSDMRKAYRKKQRHDQ